MSTLLAVARSVRSAVFQDEKEHRHVVLEDRRAFLALSFGRCCTGMVTA
jgi:hypothetical protein